MFRLKECDWSRHEDFPQVFNKCLLFISHLAMRNRSTIYQIKLKLFLLLSFCRLRVGTALGLPKMVMQNILGR